METVEDILGPHKEYVSVPEAARRLGISRHTMKALINAGKFSTMTPSKHPRIAVREIVSYEMNHRHRARRARAWRATENSLKN